MTWTRRRDIPVGDVDARRRAGTRAWRRLRRQVLTRDGWCCGCGGAATEVDHVIPVSEGGTDAMLNLVSLCSSCHKEKTQAEAKRARAAQIRRSRASEKHPGLVYGDGRAGLE